MPDDDDPEIQPASKDGATPPLLGQVPPGTLVDFAQATHGWASGHVFYLLFGEKSPWSRGATVPVASLRMTPDTFLKTVHAFAASWNVFAGLYLPDEMQAEFRLEGKPPSKLDPLPTLEKVRAVRDKGRARAEAEIKAKKAKKAEESGE